MPRARCASGSRRSRRSGSATARRGGRRAFGNDVVWVGATSVPFADVVASAYLARVQLWSDGFYATPKLYWDQSKLQGRPFYYYSYGAAVSEVVIDTLTGECARCAWTRCTTSARRSIPRSTSARSKARSSRAWAGSRPRSCGGTRAAS
jgi:hypothetical protein